jgi:ribose transport system substrate-binding protein
MSIKNTKLGAAAALLGLAATLAGCHSGGGNGQAGTTGTGGTAPATGGTTLQIAVIPKGTSHEYWKSIHAGAIKAQQELTAKGTPINILWKGTEREDDRNGQVNLVETFITQKVNGIVLAPLDKNALETPVKEAAAHKIPVVIIDSSLEGTDWTSFCATDNEKGGELAGDRMVALLGGKGRVLLLPYAQGSASTEAREAGFLTAIKKAPGITVLSANQYGGPTTDTAYKTSQNLLARYGSQTDGVFASNETNTRGMRLALKDKGLLGKVKFVGFDAAPDLVAALKAGEMQGLVVQNPFKMGYLGVTTLVDAIQGKTVPKNVDTGVALVTPETITDPKLADFLNPPISKYLNN